MLNRRTRFESLLGCLTVIALAASLGCQQAEAPKKEAAAEPHEHHHDEHLFWQREEVDQAGYKLKLGHHGADVFTGHALEPAVSITREGADIGDAQVSVSLAGPDGAEIVAEQPLVFEPKTDDEPAHYANAKLNIPVKAGKLTLKYRVVLPGDAGEVTHDVPIVATSH